MWTGSASLRGGPGRKLGPGSFQRTAVFCSVLDPPVGQDVDVEVVPVGFRFDLYYPETALDTTREERTSPQRGESTENLIEGVPKLGEPCTAQSQCEVAHTGGIGGPERPSRAALSDATRALQTGQNLV